MEFDLSDIQRAIAESAQGMLADRFPAERLLAVAGGESVGADDWQAVCDLGWPGICIPEPHGGLGLGMLELIVLAEQLGYALAPLPLLASVAAARVIETAGTEEQRARWLPQLASGEQRAALAVVSEDASALVPDGVGADLVVFIAPDGARVATAEQAAVVPAPGIDGMRRFARARMPGAGERLAGDPGQALLEAGLLIAADSLGVGRRAMDMAVDYAGTRRQFGRPIGGFQAVAHRCADMFYLVEGSRSVVYYAAWCADADPAALPSAVAFAKPYVTESALAICCSSLQVHGSVGFTWEIPLHLYLKRARVNVALGGVSELHRQRLAEMILAGTVDRRQSPAAVA